MDEKLIEVECLVEDVVYQNEDSGFAVLQVTSDGVSFVAVGELFGVEEGENLMAQGFYVDHSIYGRQFKVKFFKRALPTTQRAIKKFLSSGALNGIGPVLAGRIVDCFGEKTLEIIQQDPDSLSQVKGISPAKIEKIKDEFSKLFAMRKLMEFVENFGLKSNVSFKIWNKFGIFSLETIKSNPYQLCCEEIGVSFFAADGIAQKVKPQQNQSNRISCAVEYILRYNARENGHTCVPRPSILPVACKLLDVSGDFLEFEIDKMLDRGRICSYNMGKQMLFLPSYYMAEQYISQRICDLVDLKEDFQPEVVDALIDLEEKRLGIRFVKMQKNAIREAIFNHIFVLSGGPGTGKTTILNAIISILEQRGLEVAICAPTGRAAKRLTKMTGKEALTIHRMLGVQKIGKDKLEFVHNEKNLLKCDVVIIDEMSMVDSLLFCDIFKATRLDCKFILTGDYHQLPSVAAGNVLKSLISSERVPNVELKEIFRQSAQSLIVTNAHLIIHDELPDLSRKDSDFFFLERKTPQSVAKTIVDLLAFRLPRSYGYDPAQDIQVICPSKKGLVGTVNLNNEIQKVVNPKKSSRAQFAFGLYTFREGDKIMQIRNNYDIDWEDGSEKGNGIFNGDIGIITKINMINRTFFVDFDGKIAQYTFDMAKEIELAYAITVHKSQGNEFRCVIIPVLNKSTEFYNRNLIYTAITRARENLILVGLAQTVAQMARQISVNYRYTGLREFIAKNV